MKLGDDFKPSETAIPEGASLVDLWILSRLSEAVNGTNSGLETFNFSGATSTAYNFWLYELCDVYLVCISWKTHCLRRELIVVQEAIKPAFTAESTSTAKAAASQTLYMCLDIGLKLLHPFMPFVTEELYQRLPRRSSDKASIMVSPFPTNATFASWKNDKIEASFQAAQDIVRAIRSIRSTYKYVGDIWAKPLIFLQRCPIQTPQGFYLCQESRVV